MFIQVFDVILNKCKDDVWDYFVNPEKLKKWQPTLKSIQTIKGSRAESGAISEVIYEKNGRMIVMQEEIRRCIPYEEFTATYIMPMATHHFLIKFYSIATDKSRLHLESTFMFNGFWRYLSFFFKPFITKQLKQQVKLLQKEVNGFVQR